MEKDQIILFESRGLISITGEEAKNFLQNIITNDIGKVSSSVSIFSAFMLVKIKIDLRDASY